MKFVIAESGTSQYLFRELSDPQDAINVYCQLWGWAELAAAVPPGIIPRRVLFALANAEKRPRA